MAVDQPVPLLVKDADLKGSLDSIVVPFIVPPGNAIDRASLVLAYSNALAVLPDRSGLGRFADGRPLATLPLIGAQGAAGASIDLPGTILQSGRNEFRFQFARRTGSAAAGPGLRSSGASSSVTDPP